MVDLFREIVRYWGLIRALVVRHLAVRYRGSFLGFLWSFLNPLMLMLVYALVFKYYIRFDQVENYTVFLFCGLLPWLWVSSGLIEATSSITSHGHLITKSIFPAHILPLVAIITNLVNFLLSLPLLFCFLLFFQVEFSTTLWWLLLIIPLQFFFLQGLGLALSALNVHFRDVQHVVGNVLTFLFFLCPILYPQHIVPASFQPLIRLNPLAHLTMFYQDAILFGKSPGLWPLVYVALFSLFVLFLGSIIFDRQRESFAEML